MERKEEKEWLAIFFVMLVISLVFLVAFFWTGAKIIIFAVIFSIFFILAAFCFSHWKQEWALNELEKMMMAPYRGR